MKARASTFHLISPRAHLPPPLRAVGEGWGGVKPAVQSTNITPSHLSPARRRRDESARINVPSDFTPAHTYPLPYVQ